MNIIYQQTWPGSQKHFIYIIHFKHRVCDTTDIHWFLFCFEYQSMFQGRDLYRYNLSSICVTNDGRRRLEVSVKFMYLSFSYELRDVPRISSYILIYCFLQKREEVKLWCCIVVVVVWREYRSKLRLRVWNLKYKKSWSNYLWKNLN